MYVNGNNERYLDEICFCSVRADEGPSLAERPVLRQGFILGGDQTLSRRWTVASLAPAVYECLL